MLTPPKKRMRAFTLVEITVSVLILAILAAAAAPAYMGLRSRVILRSSAEQMLGLLAEGRLQAVKENRTVAVDFGPVLELVAERVAVSDNSIGDVVIEPRLAMLTDPAEAGTVDFSIDGYTIRFGVTPVGQGFICTPPEKQSAGYRECE